MAKKPKPNNAGHPFAGTAGGSRYFRNDKGEITDEEGKFVGAGYQKILEQQFAPQETEQSKTPSKETLEQAFPDTYSNREKKRQAFFEKESAETKRVQEELRLQFTSVQDYLKDNNALLKEVLAVQERSESLLSQIAESMANLQAGGSLGGLPGMPRTKMSFRNKMRIAGAGAAAVGAGILISKGMSGNNAEDLQNQPAAVPEGATGETPPGEALSTADKKESAAVAAAKKKQQNNITIKGEEIRFIADKLVYNVDTLTINAKTQSSAGTSGPDVGGGGTGNVGGGAATGAASGAFNSNVETPTSPGAMPGQSITGGKGAFQGFTGKSPTVESVKEDMAKAGKFTPMEKGASGLKDLIDQSAAAAGIDPRKMYGIVAGESKHGSGYDTNISSKEASYGPFQLNRKGGLGNVFEKETGLDVTDPKTLPAQAKWVANYLAKNPNMNIGGTWYGYKGDRDWNPSWGNAGYEGPEKLKAKTVAVKQTEIPASVSSMLGDTTQGMNTGNKNAVKVAETSMLSPAMRQMMASAESNSAESTATPDSENFDLDYTKYPETGKAPPAPKIQSTPNTGFDLAGYKQMVDNPLPDENVSKPIPPPPSVGGGRGDGMAEMQQRKADLAQARPTQRPTGISDKPSDRNVEASNARTSGPNAAGFARLFGLLAMSVAAWKLDQPHRHIGRR